ncbi:YpdA family putative bacillithiol disulfide reductase [Alkalibacillus salilacus]|uniref:Thioredoxin reductase (NADPH) n=1 Tax=Alkalibacillus salilacus TaxID=284582 RepID=A0ABT9VCG5_9BACI|nr:YpdA family putative bacillithiol disulfide reductase [Alkalibacillus salilacus]MDQ0158505.1 thioredoxin reductase (NADPH) [Alkalibacillus salilacus]
MKEEKIIIIGGGPCGLSAAIELKRQGFEPLIIEKKNVANSIYHYPTHQTFFSSSEKLEIGQIPFISERQKPVRNEALTYYRTVADRTKLRINTYEKVLNMQSNPDGYHISTVDQNNIAHDYLTTYLVVATGYYDHPNRLDIPGESLPHVSHYFKEAHPFYNQNVVVIGGKNSAVDATLELEKAGAHVTVLYRGADYSSSVKPWILPNFEALVRHNKIQMVFNAEVQKITEEKVHYNIGEANYQAEADFVFAMVGYHPDHQFLKSIGINIDIETGRPEFNEATMETNISNVYISGVIAAGYNNNEIFIENGRHHGEQIAQHIAEKEQVR